MAHDGRTERGTFAPGHAGGPGRSKGYAAVAKAILDRTGGGVDLVDHAIAVWRSDVEPPDRRWAAFCWLADRAIGKAVAPSVVDLKATIDAGPSLPPNWRQLGPDERRAYLDAVAARALLPSGDS